MQRFNLSYVTPLQEVALCNTHHKNLPTHSTEMERTSIRNVVGLCTILFVIQTMNNV
jgi:hypothetical protein